MPDVDDIPREPPVAGDEVATLIGSLERQRRTFAWKVGGLDDDALRTRREPSAITLGSLLKHLSLVEELYFTVRLHGEAPPAPWSEVDWEANPQWDWQSAADDPAEDLYALWNAAVEHSRGAIERAVEAGGLDFAAKGMGDGDETPSLRRIMVDIIEEYARHVGHADLIRESIDGLVGEDPPGHESIAELASPS